MGCTCTCDSPGMITNEPRQKQQNECAPSEDSDQPGHLCPKWVAKDPRFLYADSEASDQTGRVPIKI